VEHTIPRVDAILEIIRGGDYMPLAVPVDAPRHRLAERGGDASLHRRGFFSDTIGIYTDLRTVVLELREYATTGTLALQETLCVFSADGPARPPKALRFLVFTDGTRSVLVLLLDEAAGSLAALRRVCPLIESAPISYVTGEGVHSSASRALDIAVLWNVAKSERMPVRLFNRTAAVSAPASKLLPATKARISVSALAMNEHGFPEPHAFYAPPMGSVAVAEWLAAPRHRRLIRILCARPVWREEIGDEVMAGMYSHDGAEGWVCRNGRAACTISQYEQLSEVGARDVLVVTVPADARGAPGPLTFSVPLAENATYGSKISVALLLRSCHWYWPLPPLFSLALPRPDGEQAPTWLSFSRLGSEPLDGRAMMDDVWVSRNGPSLTYVTCSGYPHDGGPLLSVPCVIYRYIGGALSVVGHRERNGAWEDTEATPVAYVPHHGAPS
jgi:hypothetical protein